MVDYVKTDLMPDFDFDADNHDTIEENVEVIETTEREVIIVNSACCCRFCFSYQ